jgi:hypothetical protein
MNGYPHRIRLRGPWHCEPAGGAARRVTLPADWRDAGPATFSSSLRLRRHFGYPGRIDDDERVWLTCAGLPRPGAVSVNGQVLGWHEGPFEHDVTSLLRARNELTVDLPACADTGRAWGEVALEVRRTAFLRGLRAWWEPGPGPVRLQVTGEVVGTSARPLELYVLLGGRTLIYARADAAPAGRAFRVASEPLAPDALENSPVLRVDLIDGAVVWYATEIALAFVPGSHSERRPP